jgi:hypothetical protein
MTGSSSQLWLCARSAKLTIIRVEKKTEEPSRTV